MDRNNAINLIIKTIKSLRKHIDNDEFAVPLHIEEV
jgi:hypothetical protein